MSGKGEGDDWAEIERTVRDSFARQGLMRAIKAEITALAPGRCTIELPFSDAVGQQRGFFHGGIVGAIADTAGGYAALSAMPPGADVLTLEYKINYLRPATGRRLVAVGTVLRAGRSVSVTRAEVFAESPGGGTAVCAAMQQSIIPAPEGTGTKI